MDHSEFDLPDLISELNAAARHLQRFERAQAEATALAAPLTESLNRIAAAADMAGLDRIGALADAGRKAMDGLYATKSSSQSLPALQHCVLRMRGMASEIRVGMLDQDDQDHNLLDAFDTLTAYAHKLTSREKRPSTPVTDDNLMRARADMNAARDQALDAARLLPMDALALRVQRLAAVAQEEGARSADLAPLSNAWMGAPVLQTKLTRETGKKIRIEVIGDGIFVERRLIPVLSNCLDMLVSQAVTRSIEQAADRALCGKTDEAAISIIAACDNEGLSLTIADDGAGDREAVSLAEIKAQVAALGGGVEAVYMPGWGSSVTMAIPAGALGPWRLHVEPISAITSAQAEVSKVS